MNIRALALGTVVGFVVAFAPSCSPAKCGPQNCDGCCDAKGVCTKKPNNNNNTTCGSAGNACVDCTATAGTCASGVCSGTGAGGGSGGGGGTTGGGGGTTCTGCLLPNGSTCVPPQTSATNSVNCGLGGITCVACASGQLCNNGLCETPDAGAAGLGAACTADSDCSITLTATDTQYGIRAYCQKNALDLSKPTGQGIAFPQGFCTKRCGFESTSCGTTGQCLIALGFLGHYENMCFKKCVGQSDCRSGYACTQLSSTVNVCLPTQDDGGLPDLVDAGPGFAGASGAACADDTACQPPSTGSCITEVQTDGGMSGFTGGQCTAECGAVAAFSSGDAWCGTGGVCNPYAYNVGDNKGPLVLWQCDQGCLDVDGGANPTACRTGYVCDTGAQSYDNCVPNCNNVAGFCGTKTCNPTTGFCQ